jgi:hypothetical protein
VVGNCLPDQFFKHTDYSGVLSCAMGKVRGYSEKVKAEERGIFVGN